MEQIHHHDVKSSDAGTTPLPVPWEDRTTPEHSRHVSDPIQTITPVHPLFSAGAGLNAEGRTDSLYTAIHLMTKTYVDIGHLNARGSFHPITTLQPATSMLLITLCEPSRLQARPTSRHTVWWTPRLHQVQSHQQDPVLVRHFRGVCSPGASTVL